MRNNPCYKCEENKNCTHLNINKKCINPDGSIRLLRLMDRIEFEHKEKKMKTPKKIFINMHRMVVSRQTGLATPYTTERMHITDIEYINAEEVKELEKKAKCWDKLKESEIRFLNSKDPREITPFDEMVLNTIRKLEEEEQIK